MQGRAPASWVVCTVVCCVDTASTTFKQVQVCRLSGHFVKPLWYVPLRDGHDPLPGMHANTHLAQVCCPLSISLQAVFCVVAPCMRSFLPCTK